MMQITIYFDWRNDMFAWCHINKKLCQKEFDNLFVGYMESQMDQSNHLIKHEEYHVSSDDTNYYLLWLYNNELVWFFVLYVRNLSFGVWETMEASHWINRRWWNDDKCFHFQNLTRQAYHLNYDIRTMRPCSYYYSFFSPHIYSQMLIIS